LSHSGAAFFRPLPRPSPPPPPPRASHPFFPVVSLFCTCSTHTPFAAGPLTSPRLDRPFFLRPELARCPHLPFFVYCPCDSLSDVTLFLFFLTRSGCLLGGDWVPDCLIHGLPLELPIRPFPRSSSWSLWFLACSQRPFPQNFVRFFRSFFPPPPALKLTFPLSASFCGCRSFRASPFLGSLRSLFLNFFLSWESCGAFSIGVSVPELLFFSSRLSCCLFSVFFFYRLPD